MDNNISPADFFDNILNDEDYIKINEMIKIFEKNKNIEFEISFRNVNYVNYIRTIEHYVKNTSKKNIFQSDVLDINLGLPEKKIYRITLKDDNDIQNFIQTFSKKSQTEIREYLMTLNPSDTIDIIIKDKNLPNKLYIDDIEILFKLSDETEFSGKKPTLAGNEKILYRYKQRVTFSEDPKFKIDITDVKESYTLIELVNKKSIYEVEMEAVHNHSFKIDLILKNIYNILQIIDNSYIPIGIKEKQMVLESYKKLLNLHNINGLETRNVISLEKQHIVKFIPNKYAITDKADGDRYFLISLSTGIYLISTNMNVQKTKFISQKQYYDMILDGEYIRNQYGDMYLVFDVVYANKVDYRSNKFYLNDRIKIVNDIVDKCFNTLIPFKNYATTKKDMDLQLIKKFYLKELGEYWKLFGKKIEKNTLFITRKLYFVPFGFESAEVFAYADMVWRSYVYDKLPPYSLDGIIYTPIEAPYMIKHNLNNLDSIPLEYKWKKPSQNSIDFYIEFVKNIKGEEEIFYDNSTEKNIGNMYKICNLYVNVIDNGKEKPVIFKINNIDQKANIYIKDNEARDSEDKIIQDKTVVEFIYDNYNNNIEMAYKWIPIKTRYDKTESIIKYGKKYGNNLNIANRIWKSISDPVTEDDITLLGNPKSFNNEIDRMIKKTVNVNQDLIYYQKKTTNAKNMRAFNNYIKSNMITTYCKYKKSVLDIGCGRGGDLLKFISTNIKNYVGVDIDNNGLYIINDSAAKRYENFKKTMKHVPDMHFIHADARGLFNLQAQKIIFPNMNKNNESLITTFLENQKFDIINNQFSLHYYLSDDISWNNYCKNINNHLNDNGYMLITTFDGENIYQKLLENQKFTISYTDSLGYKKILFEIVKLFDENKKNQLGMGIDIYNSLISKEGTYIKEYLVFPEFLTKEFREKCDMELVETDTFTNLFELYKNYFTNSTTYNFIIGNENKKYENIKNFYLMMDPDNRQLFNSDDIALNKASYQLTTLNRYYIFKKNKTINLSTPSRIVGINGDIDLGKFFTPYFYDNKMFVDVGNKTNNINKLYKFFCKDCRETPNVYLIRHSLLEQKIKKDFYRWNELQFLKIKEGHNKFFLIYKSPEKYFYPIFHRHYNNVEYLISSKKTVDDLDLIVKLYSKLGNR